MNAVERLTYYSSEQLPQERAYKVPETAPPADWPSQGEITFENVTMAYRPELPPVLKNISIQIRAGEKIGVVGRTGAGKSSIMQALFRMVELREGKICIDGRDIAPLGLSELRSKLAIIPQDPQLFSGTIRSNLDPVRSLCSHATVNTCSTWLTSSAVLQFSLHDDARLYDAMKRAYLIEDSESMESKEKLSLDQGPARFSLDTDIEDGGENLSVGQRSLVGSLAGPG